MGDNNSSPPPPRPRSCVLIYSIEIRSDLSGDHPETINNPRSEPQVCSAPPTPSQDSILVQHIKFWHKLLQII